MSTPLLRATRHRAAKMGLTLAMVLGPSVPAFAAASSDAPACSGPSIVTEGTLSSSFARAVLQVRARMRANDDLDKCAVLHVESRADLLRVKVITVDGRTAIRNVAVPENLLATIEALIVLPPALPLTPFKPEPNELPDANVDEPREVHPSPTSTAHLEVGAGATGRLAGGPLYGGAGVAVVAQLALNRWLIGVTARWEAVDDTLAIVTPTGFNMQTFEVGVGLGRRATLGDFALDAVFGPEVIVESQEAEGFADGVGGTSSDVRLDLLVRMSVPREARTRFYAGADADLSPARLRRSKQLDPGLPALPAWSSGLQVGILWGAY